MTELRTYQHRGWQCNNTRACGAIFGWEPTTDLALDRKASRAAAEADGWMFVRDDGAKAEFSRQYCPECAVLAMARRALRQAKAEADKARYGRRHA